MSIYSDPAISNPADAHYRDPWPTFMRAMRDALEDIPTATPPAGMFPGKNFMADEIVSFHRTEDGWAEVSYGRGFASDWMIGITLRDTIGEAGSVEVFHTPAAAADFLREIVR